jgi:hypothetical protein
MANQRKRSTLGEAISEEVRKDQGETPTFPFSEREAEERAGLKEIVKDELGLPPGDGTPHGKGRKKTDADTPSGTLTSADREPNRPNAREHE